MRTKLLLIGLLSASLFSVKAVAQDEAPKKDVVLMDRFTMSAGANDVYKAVVTGLRDKVIGAIQKTGRVDLIDVNAEALFQQAKQDATTEDALESALAGEEVRQQAVEQLHAKYAIQGHVSNLRGVRMRTDDGSYYWNGELAISLKVIDLTNGSVKATKSYNYSGITGATGDSDVAAVTNTAEYLVVAMPKFVEENFKAEGSIIDIPTVKKNEAEEVYISLGEDMGIQKGQRFKVFVKRMVANRESKKEIGMIAVKAVEGGDLSLCEVKKGGEEILDAFKKDKDSVVIVSEKESAGKSFMKNAGAFGKGFLK